MSLVVRFTPPDAATTEQYDETIRRLQQTEDFPPEGWSTTSAISRATGTSQVQLDAFAERLMPVLADVGIDPGEPEIREIHNIIRR